MDWRQVLASSDAPTGPVTYPPDHKPFERSESGFSCSVCAAYSKEGGEHKCASPNYAKWKGDDVLDIDDPTKYCSDWFTEK